jgi:hypothetical protein
MRADAIMPDSSRSDRERIIAPGATLLLYTDSLVEKCRADTSIAIDQAAGILATHPRTRPGLAFRSVMAPPAVPRLTGTSWRRPQSNRA